MAEAVIVYLNAICNACVLKILLSAEYSYIKTRFTHVYIEKTNHTNFVLCIFDVVEPAELLDSVANRRQTTVNNSDTSVIVNINGYVYVENKCQPKTLEV